LPTASSSYVLYIDVNTGGLRFSCSRTLHSLPLPCHCWLRCIPPSNHGRTLFFSTALYTITPAIDLWWHTLQLSRHIKHYMGNYAVCYYCRPGKFIYILPVTFILTFFCLILAGTYDTLLPHWIVQWFCSTLFIGGRAGAIIPFMEGRYAIGDILWPAFRWYGRWRVVTDGDGTCLRVPCLRYYEREEGWSILWCDAWYSKYYYYNVSSDDALLIYNWPILAILVIVESGIEVLPY